MMRIGRGSGKWNMMIEEMTHRDFTVFRTNSICEMNRVIEKFGESYEILDMVCYIREDHVEVEVIYKG